MVRLPRRLTPARYLLAVLRTRPWLALGTTLLGAAWLVPVALIPLAVGAGVDAVVTGDRAALVAAAGAVVVIGIVRMTFGGLLDAAQHGMWMHGASAHQRTVVDHTLRLGAALPEQVGTGEVTAVSASDVDHVGEAMAVLGRLAGAVAAFVLVAAVLLARSPVLGAVALVGVPLAVVGIGPLLAPLVRRREAQRERLSEVTARAADIVAGLRILRGIGGEAQFLDRFRGASHRVRAAGISVVRSESWMAAAEVVLPGLVTVAIVWIGARLTMAGDLGVGELVAFYGASSFLVVPVATATEAAGVLAAALASARTACRLLALGPLLREPERPRSLPPGPLALHDDRTGARAAAGALTVLSGDRAEDLAARWSRFAEPGPATVGGVPVAEVSTAELRTRLVHAHNQDLWFAGILRAELGAAGRRTGVDEVIAAADADDVVAGLPAGLDELIGERGREVSGGQRQRLALARALLTDADVLLLDEPTSAVDAHTEARIAERVADLRRGRTTVVLTRSPLWAAVADAVVRLAAPGAAGLTEPGSAEGHLRACRGNGVGDGTDEDGDDR